MQSDGEGVKSSWERFKGIEAGIGFKKTGVSIMKAGFKGRAGHGDEIGGNG